ncbi:enterochelin esterase [Streptomyces longisporoflavus]|uniref:enterochelin esterase n=1 Tax=Streptomyces longisporoflavus TaxID=28044 RepID=UPI00167E1BBD|nr:enterochelin esterase [Streptomyces longisporoflavus]
MTVTTGVSAADAEPRRLADPAPCVRRVAARVAEADDADNVGGASDAARAVAVVIEEFWADVARRGTPLVEAVDGEPGHRDVTFLWRGHRATRQVLLLAEGIADRADLAASLLDPLPGTDIWHITYRLRADHRGSYRMAADISPGEPPASAALRRQRLLSLSAHAAPDPLNPRRMQGRWSDRSASVYELPQAPARPGAEPPAGAPRGRVERNRLPAGVLGAERDVWAYLPPGGPAAELPVLVLCDGDMWFGRLALQDRLDALIADGALPPLAVLAPDAVDRATRRREMGEPEVQVRFLADELLPWAAGRWPLTTDPARTLVAGQGLGGLVCLYAGFLRPERFGNVLAQSAPLTGDLSARLSVELSRLGSRLGSRPGAGASRPPVAVRLDVGLREAEILDHHRELYETLHSRGCRVTLNEYNGGHDWACWEAGLTEGLAGLPGH